MRWELEAESCFIGGVLRQGASATLHDFSSDLSDFFLTLYDLLSSISRLLLHISS